MKNVSYMHGRWFALVAVVALLVIATGCQSTTNDASGGVNEPPPPSLTNGGPLAFQGDASIVKVGDTLHINFFDLPTQTGQVEVQVRPDGTIRLMEDQVFEAEGLTHSQLEKEIQKRYVPAYFRSMTVVIKPREDTRLYYVGGEVRQPGGQFYRARTTVVKAIQSAGDFTDFANKNKVKLTRAGASKPIIINVKKAINNPALDLEVYPGDQIHVPRRVLW